MPKWKKKKENVFDYSFVEDVGPVIEDVDQSELLEVTESEVFNTLVGEDLFELMVFQTNLYATQKHKPFTPTNVKEIKSFIAVNFLMGIKTMPSYKDYWSSDPMLRDPYISNIMTLKRFQWLLANFHLNDNSQMPSRDDPNFDKLYKLRPLLDGLNQQYSKCYKPTEYLPTLKNNWQRCNFCSTKKEPHRTRWICTICQVPLCNNKSECFKRFHSK